MSDMTTYVLTINSRSGRPINKLTGEAWDSVAVYSKKDLDRRLEAIAEDPDLQAYVREDQS